MPVENISNVAREQNLNGCAGACQERIVKGLEARATRRQQMAVYPAACTEEKDAEPADRNVARKDESNSCWRCGRASKARTKEHADRLRRDCCEEHEWENAQHEVAHGTGQQGPKRVLRGDDGRVGETAVHAIHRDTRFRSEPSAYLTRWSGSRLVLPPRNKTRESCFDSDRHVTGHVEMIGHVSRLEIGATRRSSRERSPSTYSRSQRKNCSSASGRWS